MILTALNSTSTPLVKETLEQFSSIFCYLLQPGPVHHQRYFREIWNASFGKIEVNDGDIPKPLLALLRDRWEIDTGVFDMPTWKKARETSQAARLVISTADYEADRSNAAESSTMQATAQTLSEVSETQSQFMPSSSPDAMSGILPDSQVGDTANENKGQRRKARSVSKRSSKKQRSLKRSAQAAIELEEESQSQSKGSKGFKDATSA